MNKNFITASTLTLVCFIATGCVSDGGSYVARNSGPRFDRVDRNDPGDRSRTAMPVVTEMTAVNTRRGRQARW